MMIGVLTNVHSRQNKKGRYNRYVLKEALGKGGLIRETESLEEIPRVLEEFKKKKVQVIGVNGGDGTLSAALTLLFRYYPKSEPLPKILHMRGGTMNLASNNIEMYGTPLIVARRLRQKLNEVHHDFAQLETTSFWTLKIMASFLQHPLYGFCFGNGIIYKVIQQFYQMGGGSPAKGLRLLSTIIGGSMLQLQDTLALWEKTPGAVIVEGQTLPMKEHLFLLASTYSQLVLGFAPFIHGDRNTDDFNFIAFNVGPGETMRNLPTWMRGIGVADQLPRDDLFNDRVREVLMETRGGFTIDGETWASEKPYELRLALGRQVSFIKL
ncbi:MAG: hypothetical protein HY538_09175 [Deltaproteobacteria bacterium]|nr:hypothetical protein [Deltaproteobacteria bacterium]